MLSVDFVFVHCFCIVPILVLPGFRVPIFLIYGLCITISKDTLTRSAILMVKLLTFDYAYRSDLSSERDRKIRTAILLAMEYERREYWDFAKGPKRKRGAEDLYAQISQRYA